MVWVICSVWRAGTLCGLVLFLGYVVFGLVFGVRFGDLGLGVGWAGLWLNLLVVLLCGFVFCVYGIVGLLILCGCFVCLLIVCVVVCY